MKNEKITICLIVIGLFLCIVLCGCESPRYESNISNSKAYYEARSDDQIHAICTKRDALAKRRDAAFAAMEQLSVEEKDLMANLNDDQLVAYQFTVNAFESHDAVSQEIASRNLQKVCDANTCSVISELLLRKINANSEIDKIGKEYQSWSRDAEAKKQQSDLRYDLMMTESAQSIRH